MQKDIEVSAELSCVDGEIGIKGKNRNNTQKLPLDLLDRCDSNGVFVLDDLAGKIFSVRYQIIGRLPEDDFNSFKREYSFALSTYYELGMPRKISIRKTTNITPLAGSNNVKYNISS